jgi:alpha-tubulin suppressor-like RCC1 family protein
MSQGIRKLALLAVLLAACSSGTKIESGEPEVSTVTIAPAADTVEVAGSATYVATAREEDGTIITGREVTWASSNTAVATVNSSGTVTGVASGATSITATVDGTQGNAVLVVLPPGGTPTGDVATVTVVPPSATLTVGNTVQLVATPQDSNGNVVTGVVPAWSSRNDASSVSSSGLVTAENIGVDTITATVGTVTGISIITVTSVPIGSITVTPGQGTLDAAGATLQLSSTVTSEGGQVLPGAKVTWSSSNTAVARVDSTGFVTTSLVPGNVVISASAGGKVGTGQFSVILSFRSISSSNGTAGETTCGVTAVRAAYCWGNNGHGNMGIGTQTSWNGPIAVIGNHAFTSVATGGDHACGITVNGDAFCWGSNGSGQLGSAAVNPSLIPVKVSGSVVFDTTSITSGLNHSCALTSAGAAYCWGSDASGQLGAGGPGNQSTPTAVSGGLLFRQISAGEAHTCAVTTGGAAYCWGAGGLGRLGTGNTSSSTTPVAVTGGLTFSEVTAGGLHSCGITTVGSNLYCWGDNSEGQFGSGNFASSNAPVAVFGGQSWAQVDAGVDGTCGVVSVTVTGGRSGHCWGSNEMAQIGNGDSVQATKYVVPAAVQGPSALLLSRGETHNCLVSTNGVAYCWGRNFSGQVGNGQFTTSPPFSIPLPTKVIGQP